MSVDRYIDKAEKKLAEVKDDVAEGKEKFDGYIDEAEEKIGIIKKIWNWLTSFTR